MGGGGLKNIFFLFFAWRIFFFIIFLFFDFFFVNDSKTIVSHGCWYKLFHPLPPELFFHCFSAISVRLALFVYRLIVAALIENLLWFSRYYYFGFLLYYYFGFLLYYYFGFQDISLVFKILFWLSRYYFGFQDTTLVFKILFWLSRYFCGFQDISVAFKILLWLSRYFFDFQDITLEQVFLCSIVSTIWKKDFFLWNCTINSRINNTPKGFYWPISKLHSLRLVSSVVRNGHVSTFERYHLFCCWWFICPTLLSFRC